MFLQFALTSQTGGVFKHSSSSNGTKQILEYEICGVLLRQGHVKCDLFVQLTNVAHTIHGNLIRFASWSFVIVFWHSHVLNSISKTRK